MKSNFHLLFTSESKNYKGGAMPIYMCITVNVKLGICPQDVNANPPNGAATKGLPSALKEQSSPLQLPGQHAKQGKECAPGVD